ncbi:MAG TPA: hypothetical protein VFU82_04370 [Gammaproteobacteria bacterium]|nr:hypothetical protein [Gammaproteobacteria bacterium]
MANNRSLEAGTQGAMRALSDFENTVHTEIMTALAEGKAPGAYKEKEKHKILFFEDWWVESLAHLTITDAQSIINHFTIIANNFDGALADYCKVNKINQDDIFSLKKIELFKKLIPLRQAITLMRYYFNTLTPHETPEKGKDYFGDLGARAEHVVNRMNNLKEKMIFLEQENNTLVDFISVLVQHIQVRGLGFADKAEPAYQKPYSDQKLILLSTLLNGLPYHASLERAMHYLDGKLDGGVVDLEEAKNTIQTNLNTFNALIEFFTGEEGWLVDFLSACDVALAAWLRRAEELSRLLPNLKLEFGRELLLKIQRLSLSDIEGHVSCLLGRMKDVSHLPISPNKAWPRASKEIKDSLKNLKTSVQHFVDHYHHQAFEDLFKTAEQSILEFNTWHNDVFKPQVANYQQNVVKLHQYLQALIFLLHEYHALMKQYNQTRCQRLGFFFKHNAIFVAAGGVTAFTVALPMCLSFFSLGLLESLSYSAVSFFLGAGSGCAVGAIKERCRPSTEEAPLLIPKEPSPPSPHEAVRPSYHVSLFAVNLFPSVQYREREKRDIERGYGSMKLKSQKDTEC